MGLGPSRQPRPIYDEFGPNLYYRPRQPTFTAKAFDAFSWLFKSITVIVGIIAVLVIVVLIYNIVATANGQPSTALFGPSVTTDLLPTPIDGKTATTIKASNVPLTAGSDYGMQFWMYIKDWDYKFGSEKNVIKRVDATNAAISNPRVMLDATENNLVVHVPIYGSAADATSSVSAKGSDTAGNDFTCTVENVPLQTWFAVSITMFQRNLDIYINGKLVKSCVLPGMPRPAVGDIIVSADGGFSGSVCNVHGYSTMLGPTDTVSFFSAGTPCAATVPGPSSNTANSGMSFTLFGYTYTFAVKDSSGKTVQSYSF